MKLILISVSVCEHDIKGVRNLNNRKLEYLTSKLTLIIFVPYRNYSKQNSVKIAEMSVRCPMRTYHKYPGYKNVNQKRI